jgi:hypothetical protein
MDGACGEKSRSMKQSDLPCLALEIAKLAERWYRIEVLNSKSEPILRPDVSGLRGWPANLRTAYFLTGEDCPSKQYGLSLVTI